ncbi:hypothetical protein KA005_68580, partial [bacterium]|nr:hypothetical protein [bacterium]
NKIIATYYNSNFPYAKGNYNGISAASDGKIYYVLCSESIEIGAQMYVFVPGTEKISHLGDLTEVCGEKELKAIPQGKCHVSFFEYMGKLYFGTHTGYYKREGDKEASGDAPPGYKPYQGGHVLTYDLKTGKYEDLGVAPKREGIIALTMDTVRGRVYCITWPTGYIFRYDVTTDEMEELGKFFDDGELGKGDRYQKVSRSLAVNPENGSVFFNNAEGKIFEYIYEKDKVETVETENLLKDYFGSLDPNSPGTMGYQWRQSVWSEFDKMIYATHIESEYLFRYDPRTKKVEFVERIASLASRKAGMTGYGVSLGLVFGNDKHTLYHISHAHPCEKELEGLAMEEQNALKRKNHHLISYDIKNGKYADLGKIIFKGGDEPIHINSLTIGQDGVFYALCYRELESGKT